MKIVIVNYPTKLVPEKVKRELFWYDPLKKIMLRFEGGQLKFEYQEDKFLVEMGESERKRKGIKSTYRMMPKVIDLEIKDNKRETDKDKLKKWFDQYLNYNDSGSEIDNENNDNIAFVVPDDEVDDFSYQLSRNNFEFRIL
jgi:hypothetical protein